jgi:hypothetical protein
MLPILLISIPLALLFSFVALILLAPIVLSGSGAVTASGAGSGGLRISWLYPAIVRASLDFKDGSFVVEALWGRKLFESGDRPAFSSANRDSAAPTEPGNALSKNVAGEKPEPAASSESSMAAKGKSAEPSDTPHDKPAAKARTVSSRFAMLKRLWVYCGNESFRGKILRWLGRFVRSLFRMCRISRINVFVKGGFSDPSQTGALYGWYQALAGALTSPSIPRYALVYEPTFASATFEGSGNAVLTTSVGRLLWPFAVAIFTFPYIHAFILFRRARTVV